MPIQKPVTVFDFAAHSPNVFLNDDMTVVRSAHGVDAVRRVSRVSNSIAVRIDT